MCLEPRQNRLLCVREIDKHTWKQWRVVVPTWAVSTGLRDSTWTDNEFWFHSLFPALGESFLRLFPNTNGISAAPTHIWWLVHKAVHGHQFVLRRKYRSVLIQIIFQMQARILSILWAIFLVYQQASSEAICHVDYCVLKFVHWPALCAGLLCCHFFEMLTPVPYHHFFSSLILLFIYV